MNLLDLIAATDARDEALAKVSAATDTQWATEVWAIILDLATDTFTSDDIWQALEDRGLPTPREPRALGAILRQAATDNLIAATAEYRPSHRVACHARPIRVWRKL